MAQLVARLVRNEKVGGSNPPSSTTGRHPIRMSVFVCLAWCCGACCCGALSPLVFRVSDVLFVPGCLVCPWAVVFLLLLIVAPTDLRPPRGLPARSPSAPRASLGASARSPARPRHRPPAPRPGPATDHGHRSLAPSLPTGTAVPSGPSGAFHTSGAAGIRD